MFRHTLVPSPEEESSSWWFIFRGDRLMVKPADGGVIIPRQSDIPDLPLARTHFMGTLDHSGCFVAEVDEHLPDPTGMAFQDLRTLLPLLSEEMFAVAGRAFQNLHWDRTHQFCGRCGSPLEHKQDEHARQCPSCSLLIYPALSPAVIVAVVKGDEILLARSKRFTGSFYSVLAGFVEPGETLEECVRREIMEEVGVELGAIRYFGSQPWPFPSSLMVGFTAAYAGGEIVIDEHEITEAQWFTAAALPAIPRTGTIARQLIDWFAKGAAS